MEENSAMLNIVLYLAYFLTFFALAAAILLPLIKSLDHPQGLIKVAGGIVLLIVIFGISYALSSSRVGPGVENITDQGSRMIGAALIMMYILLFISLAGILVTEVSKFFR